MSTPRVEVQINVGAFVDVPATLVERAVRATLDAEGQADAEVSVTFLGDGAIQELNRGYLGRDRPTDVISFSLGDAEAPLGDVYVGVLQARRQAAEHRVSIREELVRLTIHGTLHVLGYEHPEGAERVESPMFVRQEELVRAVMGVSSELQAR